MEIMSGLLHYLFIQLFVYASMDSCIIILNLGLQSQTAWFILFLKSFWAHFVYFLPQPYT